MELNSHEPWPTPEPTPTAPVWLRSTPPPELDLEAARTDSDQAESDDVADEPDGEAGQPSRAHRNAAMRRRIGGRFVEARTLNGWDQGEAAKALGYANSTQLSLVEQGKRLPPHEVLLRASEVFAVAPEFLLGVSDEPERDPRTATRAAMLRRIDSTLKHYAGVLADLILDSAAHPGEDALRVSRFASRADALCHAVSTFRELNAKRFDDLPGGATLLRATTEMADAVQQVENFLQRDARTREAAERLARERVAAAQANASQSPTT